MNQFMRAVLLGEQMLVQRTDGKDRRRHPASIGALVGCGVMTGVGGGVQRRQGRSPARRSRSSAAAASASRGQWRGARRRPTHHRDRSAVSLKLDLRAQSSAPPTPITPAISTGRGGARADKGGCIILRGARHEGYRRAILPHAARRRHCDNHRAWCRSHQDRVAMATIFCATARSREPRMGGNRFPGRHARLLFIVAPGAPRSWIT